MASPNKRSRKRVRRAEALGEAREKFKYALIAVEALRGLDLEDLQLRVADVEVIPAFDGTAEGMCGWLIFPDPRQAKAAARSETASKVANRLKQTLAAGEFPQEAISSFVLRFTSLPEIDKVGGRFSFLRSA